MRWRVLAASLLRLGGCCRPLRQEPSPLRGKLEAVKAEPELVRQIDPSCTGAISNSPIPRASSCRAKNAGSWAGRPTNAASAIALLRGHARAHLCRLPRGHRRGASAWAARRPPHVLFVRAKYFRDVKFRWSWDP